MTNIDIVRTPAIVAAEINSIKFQTRNVLIFNSIEIGKRLTEAKNMMEHGQFGKWLAEEVDYSQSTANNLMKIYEQYGADQGALFGDNSKSQTFANLSYSQAVALLGIPADEREQFIEQNNAAELSIRELKARIKEFEEKQQAMNEHAGELNDRLSEAQENVKAEAARADGLLHALNKKDDEMAKAIASAEARAYYADAKCKKAETEKERYAEEYKKYEAEANARIKELEAELNKPATVTTTVVEKVPDEVQKELEELRAAVSKKPISDSDAAAKAEIALLFTATKDSFNKMLAAVAKLEDVELRSKYYGAAVKLAESIKTVAEAGADNV